MADDDNSREVNSQITDAVTQTNVKVVAEAPAEAVAMVYQTLAQTVSMQMQNAASAQQNLQSIASAAIGRAVKDILGGDSDVGGQPANSDGESGDGLNSGPSDSPASDISPSAAPDEPVVSP